VIDRDLKISSHETETRLNFTRDRDWLLWDQEQNGGLETLNITGGATTSNVKDLETTVLVLVSHSIVGVDLDCWRRLLAIITYGQYVSNLCRNASMLWWKMLMWLCVI